MSYETEHDFNWVLGAFPPRGQIPGAPLQTLPNRLSDIVAPTFDALGWQRYGAMVFETANALNANIISLGVVASGQARYYPWVQIRAAGGAAAGTFWVAVSNGTNPVAISPGIDTLANGEATSPPIRGVLVPAGFLLQARSDQLSGVGTTIFIEAYFITLNTAESIQPT